MEAPENQLKYENYKEQIKRLNSAISHGFNLEAMFIEYAIIEDRTESILRHAEKWDAYLKKRNGRSPTLNSKVNYIQKLAAINNDLLHKYFADDLLGEVLGWKDDRNRLIHALLDQQFKHNELSSLAMQGKQLVNELRKRAGNYNRAIERRKAKDLL